MKKIVCLSVLPGNGGKYTATNLAYHTKTMFPTKNVLLIDFDFECPYLAANISTNDTFHSIDNLTDKIDGGFLDETLFKANMVSLRNGVDVLKGTKNSYSKNFIEKKHIDEVLAFADKLYDYVYIVVSNSAIKSTIYPLFESDEVVFVARNNHSNYMRIENTLKFILSYTKDSVKKHLVINQYSEISDINLFNIVKNHNFEGTELIEYMPESFDNADLDKGLGQKGFLKNKKLKSQEQFEGLINRIVMEEK